MAQCFEGIAATLAKQGDADRATQCYAAAAALRDALKTPMSALEQGDHGPILADVRAALTGDASGLQSRFDCAWALGQRLAPAELDRMAWAAIDGNRGNANSSSFDRLQLGQVS
jgi:hypothetical protein